MYTTCPDCSSVYEITPEEIAIASGLVRCGNCDATFSAIRRLSATPPADTAVAEDTSDTVSPNQSSLDFEHDPNQTDAAPDTPGQALEETPTAHQYVDLDSQEFMDDAGDIFDELTEFAEEPEEFFDADAPGDEPDSNVSESEVETIEDDHTSDTAPAQPDDDSPNDDEQSPINSTTPTESNAPERDNETHELIDHEAADSDQVDQVSEEVLDQWNTEEGEHDLEALLADDEFMSDEFTEDDLTDGTNINEPEAIVDEFVESDESIKENEETKIDINGESEAEDAPEADSDASDDHAIGHDPETEARDDTESDRDTTRESAPDTAKPEGESEDSAAIEDDKHETEAHRDDDQEQPQADQDEEKSAADTNDDNDSEQEQPDDTDSPDAATDESNRDDSEAVDDDSEPDAQAHDEGDESDESAKSNLPPEDAEPNLTSVDAHQTEQEHTQTGDQHEDEQKQSTDDTWLESQNILTDDVDGQFEEEINDKHDYKDISHYLKPGKSLGRRIAQSVLALLLVTGLGAQYIHHERARLAIDPRFGDVVLNAYKTLGLELQPTWSVADYRIARHTIVPHQLNSRVLMARATIINNSPHTRPMPLLRLEIKNRWGDVVFARIFSAEEYLAQNPAGEISGNARVEASVDLINPTDETEIGYSFDVCLKIPSGAVDCGEMEIFTQ